MPLRKSTSYFIKKAKKIHGDKYDYSEVKYVHSADKVKIICPIHGAFLQSPDVHYMGCGCQKCGIELSRQAKIKSTKRFIEQARKKHGKKFDYSKVEYVMNNKKVLIICPVHGEFKQTPTSHLSSPGGCRKCSNEKLAKERKLSRKEFVVKAKECHGDKYGYDLVEYKNTRTPVKIVCFLHGVFCQEPGSHIYQQCGCPVCGKIYAGKKIQKKLLGERFGKLMVTDGPYNEKKGTRQWQTKWMCRCDCGRSVKISTDHLRSGHTKSCGCISRSNQVEVIKGRKKLYSCDVCKKYLPANNFTRRIKNRFGISYMCKSCKRKTDSYFKSLICQSLKNTYGVKCEHDEIPDEIVELKQRQLSLTRQLKKAKEVQNASNY